MLGGREETGNSDLVHEPQHLPAQVTVTAPARLHLGFLDLNGGLGRRFGSLGITLDAPATRLVLAFAAQESVRGPDAARARALLARAAAAEGIAAPLALTIVEAIPAHAGLGSGTQLALAIAAAAARLAGHPADVARLAAGLDRGARSGIGIAAFAAGGVILDGGRGPATAVPPVIARLAFPPAWRILLLADPAAEGLSGRAEQEAFARLPPFPDREAASLCRLVVMAALPALAERDLAGFGAAVTEWQERIGDHFAAVQGGRFTSPRVAAALAALRREGVAGVGQSSWGPTGFALFAAEAEAERARAAIDPALGLTLCVTRGRNRGAEVRVSDAGEG